MIFLSIVEDTLTYVITHSNPNTRIVFAGDFNVNFADMECPRAVGVVSLLAGFGLQPTVDFPKDR